MKIKKTELLKFIDGAEKRLREQHQLKHQEAIAAEKARFEKWEQTQGPVWDEALKAMTAARKRKQPVTRYLYPTNSVFGTPLALPKPTPFVLPEELAGMRNLLQAISDDEIEVRQLGLGDIRDLYRTYGTA